MVYRYKMKRCTVLLSHTAAAAAYCPQTQPAVTLYCPTAGGNTVLPPQRWSVVSGTVRLTLSVWRWP